VSISTNGSTEAKPAIIIPHVEGSGTLRSVGLRLLAIAAVIPSSRAASMLCG
jgi:hypothetical protein